MSNRERLVEFILNLTDEEAEYIVKCFKSLKGENNNNEKGYDGLNAGEAIRKADSDRVRRSLEEQKVAVGL